MKQLKLTSFILKSACHLCILLSATLSLAQGGPDLFSGTGYMANGQIGVLLEDAEAVIQMPAMLAGNAAGSWMAGAAVRSGLDDWTEAAGAIDLKLPWQDHLGLGIQHAGIEGYSEQRINLSYARKLWKVVYAGVQFDVHRNAAEEYETLYAAAWGVSFYAPLMKQLSLGAWIYNPTGQSTSLDVPTVIRIGTKYTPSPKISLALEAEKDLRYDVRFKAGLHYHLHDRLTVHWGMGTQPALIHAGMTWHILQRMAIRGGWRYHSHLGSSFAGAVSQYHRS